MSNKKREIQQKIEKALKLMQSARSTDTELVAIKLILEQNMKEVSVIIKRRLHKVSQAELPNWLALMKFLGGKGLGSQLKELFYREDIDLRLKKEMAEVAAHLGSEFPSQLIELLKESNSLYDSLFKILKERKGIKKPALSKFLELPEFLQIPLLNQLISETGESSLLLINKLLGSGKKLDAFLITKLGEIAHTKSAEILYLWLESCEDKAQKKQIKKSLYKLKLKGIQPKAPGKKAKAEPLKLDIPVEDIAYASHIDALGERFLLLAREQPPRGLKVFQVFISGEKGIFKVDSAEMRGRDFRQLIRRMETERKIMIIQMEPDYCQFLIEEAAQINSTNKHPFPDRYEELKNWLHKPDKPYQESIIYRFLPLSSLEEQNELVEKSADLLKTDPFRGWMLPPEEMEKPAQQLKEAMDSRLLLTPIQQRERIALIYGRVAEKYFKPQRRKSYQRYLEEMAYLLLIKGKKNKAKIALATALALEEQAPILIPFIIELVKRSIFAKAGFAPKEELEPKKKEDSRIIIPSRETESGKREDSRIITSTSESTSQKREDSGLIIPPDGLKGK